MNWSLVRSMAATLLLAPQLRASPQQAPQVKTSAGIVEGTDDGKARTFLGIPYAEPPVGNQRWKPPVPAASWTGVRKAARYGAHCMQGRVFGDMVFHDPGQSEDCLTLNVWAPAKATSGKLPVMVWIYGGGFVAGTTSEGRQHGEVLAQQGVIVVSMNYRLGIFGFLVLPELIQESAHGAAGNYGLLDQTLALRWVHDNIAAFGGDPGNVTIFGESAGSFSVSAQMASPLAKGLFDKAIGQSGAAFFSRAGLRFEPASARAERDAKTVSDKLGTSKLTELRALPADKVLESFAPPKSQGFEFGPDVDGYFLPESVPAIFAAGKQNDVALMAGWNHDEGGLGAGVTAEGFRAIAEKDFGSKAPEFLTLYPIDTDAKLRRSVADYSGDQFIAFGTWQWLEAQTKTGKRPSYRYRFDMEPTPKKPDAPRMGAYHSAEIEYVFGQLDTKEEMSWRADDRRVSEMMQKYWANFARSGNPNGPGLPQWPAYGASTGWPVMILSAQPSAQKDDLRTRYLFLAAQSAN